MDAVPVTLGQEFGGYAAQVRQGIARIEAALGRVGQIPLGGTATGTGLNTHPEFAERVRAILGERDRPAILRPGRPLRGAGRPRRARRGLGRAQDRRRLAHQDRERHPAHGLGPARRPCRDRAARAAEGQLDHAGQGQPGHPRGRDAGLGAGDRERRGDHRRRACRATSSSTSSCPLIARNLLESIRLLASAARLFAEKCVDGIEANRETCERYAELTLSAATALNPYVGYDKASEIVKEAVASGRSLREVAREAGVDEDVLDQGARLPRHGQPARLLGPLLD